MTALLTDDTPHPKIPHRRKYSLTVDCFNIEVFVAPYARMPLIVFLRRLPRRETIG
jgi:hypothetical protein